MPPKPLWPEGAAIDKMDKEISARFFKMQLKLWEYPLSLFCLLGMPLSLLVGPVSLAMLYGGPRPKITFLVWLVAVTPVVYVWGQFCLGKVRQTSTYLFSLKPLVVAAPVGLLLARIAGEEAFAVGAFHTTAWFASMLPVQVMKRKFGRRRPVVCSGLPAPTRMILSISEVVRQDAHASFPSGDTCSAVAYVMPLALACGWPVMAILILGVCGLARMYWRAHYAFDVLAGAGIGLVVCLALHSTISPIGAVKWWHPFVAQALMIGLAFTLRRLK